MHTRQPSPHEDVPHPGATPISGAPSDPYRLSMTKAGGLEVSARLRTLDDLDELQHALDAWKVLLKRAEDIKKPDDDQQKTS